MGLTNYETKIASKLYKTYLDRTKNGMTRSEAKDFEDFDKWSKELFPEENTEDLKEAVSEICVEYNIQMDMNCGFVMSGSMIAYMENRFKNGVKEVAEFIGTFL